jgi:hypothetical protein
MQTRCTPDEIQRLGVHPETHRFGFLDCAHGRFTVEIKYRYFDGLY